MTQPASRIIKSGQIDVEGRFALDLGHSSPSGHGNKNAAGIAKVRILENQNEFAVMEIICSCGKKTVIRCDYGDLAAVKNAESRAQAAVNSGRPAEKKP